jgi:hypothetical protein
VRASQAHGRRGSCPQLGPALALTAVLTLLSLSRAECLPPAGAAFEDEPLGRLAIAWLAETVRAIEPALPRTRTAAALPVDEDDPLHEPWRYLRERAIVPPSFDVDAFDAAAWQALLDEWLATYGLPGVRVGPASTPGDLRADLEAVAMRVLDVIRPVALLAWDPADDERLAFVGVVWNWSPYPRLLVWRPPEGWSMRDGARELAGRIDFCGRPVSAYVSASAPVARSLFLDNVDTAMYLVGSEPETRSWPHRVESGEEVDVFAFEHPEVAHLDAFSAVFVGAPPGVLQLMRLLPQVRTNLSPMGLARVLQTPPRRD